MNQTPSIFRTLDRVFKIVVVVCALYLLCEIGMAFTDGAIHRVVSQ